MQTELDSELELLRQLTVSELHERYVDLFQETPRSRNKVWLVRKIAWRLQSQAEGALSARARRRAAELAVDAAVRTMPAKNRIPQPTAIPEHSRRTPQPSPKDRRRNNCRLPDVEHVFNVLGTMESCPTYFCSSPKDIRLPSAGTSLVRDYKGRRIEVRIVSGGFEYDGDRFKSLSAIAKFVTGSHCNGFRFFQLGTK